MPSSAWETLDIRVEDNVLTPRGEHKFEKKETEKNYTRVALSYCSFTRNVPLASPLIFFFNDTATTEIYTLSLHDALPIWLGRQRHDSILDQVASRAGNPWMVDRKRHTSELQSPKDLVCRLLLEKKRQ